MSKLKTRYGVIFWKLFPWTCFFAPIFCCQLTSSGSDKQAKTFVLNFVLISFTTCEHFYSTYFFVPVFPLQTFFQSWFLLKKKILIVAHLSTLFKHGKPPPCCLIQSRMPYHTKPYHTGQHGGYLWTLPFFCMIFAFLTWTACYPGTGFS